MRRLASVGVVAVVAVCALGVAPAFGAFTYPFDGQLAPAGGAFEHGLSAVAVDDESGRTYVAEVGGVVNVFETVSGTQLAALDGSLTPAGSFGGNVPGVAADNASGRVYVLDSTDNVVDVFDSAGSYVCQITGSSTPSASECNGVAGSDTPAHGFNEPHGITVDQATGRVYVVDANNGVVDVFSSGGAYLPASSLSLASIEGGFSAAYTRGIAVDDVNGHVYVADSNEVVVDEFGASGEFLAKWHGANTPAGSFGGGWVGVAADDTSGEVYVTDTAHEVIDVFSASGSYLAQLGQSVQGPGPPATAIDQASGKVYMAADSPPATTTFEPAVEIFGPGVVVPDVTTGAASSVLPTGATLNGTVNPDGIQLTDCHFEYGTSEAYGHSAPCVPAAGGIPADSSDHAVTAVPTGLTAGTTYHFRLAGANANGPNTGSDATFSTPPPPAIDGAAAKNVTTGSADLTAQVNPDGFDTTYRFEWGTSTAYGTSAPVPAADIGAGMSVVPVATHLSGLSPNTTYHWRVVAQNANGTTATDDHTFIYSTIGGALPDNREYEMVTPVQKNGALIGFFSNAPEPAMDIAESGSRLVAPVTACFAGGGSCLPLRGQTAGASYEFERTPGGWATSSLSLADGALENVFLLSADSGKELLTLPNESGKEDWYTVGEGGSLAHIGPAGPAATGQGENAELINDAGRLLATSDMSHIVWSTEQREYRWPFDLTTPLAPGSLNVNSPSTYEYVGTGGAVPAMVGVTGGAGSTDLASICGTDIPEHQPGALSADGSVVFFIALACSTGSGANAGVAVPADQLWARIDEARSAHVSERSPSDCTGACATSAVARAEFLGASADGGRAFFTSIQQLTNDASQDTLLGDGAGSCYTTVGVNGCNLYLYDFSRPTGENLIDVSAGDSSGGGPRVRGVMGMSSDGSHVYFVAQGVLTQAANSRGETAKSGANNLYVYERDAAHPEGETVFITALPGGDVKEWKPGEGVSNVTPDGRFLVFRSHGDLTADDTSLSGAMQLFRYDAQSGQLIRISVGDLGFDDNGNRSTATPCSVGGVECSEDVQIVGPQSRHDLFADPRRDLTMSHDGAYVFFTSPVALTRGALDDVQAASGAGLEVQIPHYAQNVYEWHAGQTYLISDGKDTSQHDETSAVALMGTDATGANVFFSTADPLVPQDTDTQVDIYDARICTASEPCVQPAAQVEACQGDSCHAPPAPAPGSVSVASATLTGAGNLAPAPVVAGHKKAVVKKKHAKHRKRKGKAKRGHKARIRRTGGKSGVRS